MQKTRKTGGTMALQIPDSMDELVYWTNRTIGDGKVTVWVKHYPCPKCKKAMMGKPVDEEGNVKIRAKEYVCPACKYTVEKAEYEETLTAEVIYTCPFCGFKGEYTAPFKRRNIEGVPTFRFQCAKCHANIDVTKKMKEKKKKDDVDVDLH